MTTTTRRMGGMGAMRAMRYATAGTVSVLLLLVLGLSACGGTEDAAQHSGGVVASSGRAAAEQQAAPAAGEFAAGEASVPGDWAAQGGLDRKIVKTAELGIRAKNVRESAAQAQQVAAQFGGSVLSSQIDGGDGSTSAALVLSVPSPEFEKALEQLQGRMQYLEERTASSQISLSIQPVARPTPPSAWSPAHVVSRAWDASLGVLQALATVVLSGIVFGWWLAPALVVGFVWWRRRTRDSTPAATG